MNFDWRQQLGKLFILFRMVGRRNLWISKASMRNFCDASCNLRAADCNQLEKENSQVGCIIYRKSSSFIAGNDISREWDAIKFTGRTGKNIIATEKLICIKNDGTCGAKQWMHSSCDGMCRRSRCFLSAREQKRARNKFQFNLHQSKYHELAGRLSAQLKLIYFIRRDTLPLKKVRSILNENQIYRHENLQKRLSSSIFTHFP